jgi:hypothetical protein
MCEQDDVDVDYCTVSVNDGSALLVMILLPY